MDRLTGLRCGRDDKGGETLFWEVETTALTPQVAKLLVIVLALLFVFVTVIFGVIRGGAFLEAAIMAVYGYAGALALFAFVIFGLLLNRLRRVYLLTETFYASSLSDPRLFAGVAAAGAVGAASARPALAGGAVAAAASRGERHPWTTVKAVSFDPRHHRIHVRLHRFGWLGHDRIDCPEDAYPAASAWVARHVGSDRAKAGPSTSNIATERVEL